MRGGMRAAMLGGIAACAFAACGGGDAKHAGGDAGRAAAGGSSGRTAVGCHARIRRGVIPPWARAGFSAAAPRMPHVVGRSGEIAALVFGDPLSSPPRPSHNNKILWVARSAVRSRSDLRITARRYAAGKPAGTPVRRVVAGGPGPSIVDLPAPGCWHLELRWSGHADAMDLRYAPRS